MSASLEGHLTSRVTQTQQQNNTGIWNGHVSVVLNYSFEFTMDNFVLFKFCHSQKCIWENAFWKHFSNASVTLQHKLGTEVVRVKLESINIELIDPCVVRIPEFSQAHLFPPNCYWCKRLWTSAKFKIEMFLGVNRSIWDLSYFTQHWPGRELLSTIRTAWKKRKDPAESNMKCLWPTGWWNQT